MASYSRISEEERMRRRKRKKLMRILVKSILMALIILVISAVILTIVYFIKRSKDTTPTDNEITSIDNENKLELQNEENKDNSITEGSLLPDGNNQNISGETNLGNQTPVSGAITHEDPSVYAEFMNKGHTVNVTAGSYDQYSREKIPYGFGAKFDDKNRPEGCGYYTTKYAKYGADYIMPDSKYIFLTMDNGYEAGTTEDILNTLEEKNVPCVFFLTKPYCQSEPELVKRMIADGHVIGNHTTTHPAGGIQAYSADKMYNDIKECSDYIEQNFGYKPYLFRFPEGSSSEQALAVVQSLNMRPVFWSYAYKDWDINAQPDVSTSLKNALDRVHGGEIILLHAESRTNADMLADFIDGVRAKGFEFAFYSKVD